MKPETDMKKESKIIYVCGTHWKYEFKEGQGTVYTTVEDLKMNCECWIECGVAKLEVKFKNWEEDPTI